MNERMNEGMVKLTELMRLQTNRLNEELADWMPYFFFFANGT